MVLLDWTPKINLTTSLKAGSPGRNAINHYSTRVSTYLAYALIIAGLVLTTLYTSNLARTLGVLICITSSVYLALLFYHCKRAFRSYYDQCLQDDLADIAQHYRLVAIKSSNNGLDWVPSGASGFWVAEGVTADGYDIVGSVALGASPQLCMLHCTNVASAIDASSAGEPGTGELRRMLVSPRHRRRGVGAKLSQTLLAHAREHKLSSLVLTTTNFQPDAIRMYESGGWIFASARIVRSGLVAVRMITYRKSLLW